MGIVSELLIQRELRILKIIHSKAMYGEPKHVESAHNSVVPNPRVAPSHLEAVI